MALNYFNWLCKHVSTWPVSRLFQLVTCLDRSYIPMILNLFCSKQNSKYKIPPWLRTPAGLLNCICPVYRWDRRFATDEVQLNTCQLFWIPFDQGCRSRTQISSSSSRQINLRLQNGLVHWTLKTIVLFVQLACLTKCVSREPKFQDLAPHLCFWLTVLQHMLRPHCFWMQPS